MTVSATPGFFDFGWWGDLDFVRTLLDAGADPDEGESCLRRPLHLAARLGPPEVVAELAGRVRDIDAECEGRSALWEAVFHHRFDNALALVAAGADPWRPMMAGWSPGRLSLAGPRPGLFFPFPPGHAELTEAEEDAVEEAERLIDVLGEIPWGGYSLSCVRGLSAAEAARRLAGEPVDKEVAAAIELPDDPAAERLLGFTDVPGGCVLTHPWGFLADTPGVMKALSAGTVVFGVYHNPKGGADPSVYRDGEIVVWDTHPGVGDTSFVELAEEVLFKYLYGYEADAYCAAGAGLRPADARSITDPDAYLRLPDQDYWQ